MTLTISPEVEALIQREMRSGHFQSSDELIATALHVVSDSTPTDLDLLRQKLQERIDSADRGEFYTEEEARASLTAVRTKL